MRPSESIKLPPANKTNRPKLDEAARAFVDAWVASATKCRPREEWQWQIMERDYLNEWLWVRAAFVGSVLRTTPPHWLRRGSTWEGVEAGARMIAAAIGKRITESGRQLPYVCTLWRL